MSAGTGTPRVALVHERFTEIAGSEHVVEQLALQWPDAPVFASLSRPGGVPEPIRDRLTTTALERAYRALGERSYAPCMPLMGKAFRTLPLEGFDAVVVSHHAFAIQAVLATSAPVVAYVHSPARWAWDVEFRKQEAGGRVADAVLAGLAAAARKGELSAQDRATVLVANSHEVQQRISRWWGRESEVVHPPVDTEGYTPDPGVDREDFFLLAGRLVPYKRPDIAITAARRAGVRLVVAGDGRAAEQCRRLAGDDTTFLGRVSHEELLRLHRSARALLMPGIEDFGIVPVEAMATGTPVIALGAGGALDSVIPELSGQLVAPGTDDEVIESFADALTTFRSSDYDPSRVRGWAEGFSRRNFRNKMRAIVDRSVGF